MQHVTEISSNRAAGILIFEVAASFATMRIAEIASVRYNRKELSGKARTGWEQKQKMNMNQDSMDAIAEVQALKKNPNKKAYGSFSEILKEMDESINTNKKEERKIND